MRRMPRARRGGGRDNIDVDCAASDSRKSLSLLTKKIQYRDCIKLTAMLSSSADQKIARILISLEQIGL